MDRFVVAGARPVQHISAAAAERLQKSAQLSEKAIALLGKVLVCVRSTDDVLWAELRQFHWEDVRRWEEIWNKSFEAIIALEQMKKGKHGKLRRGDFVDDEAEEDFDEEETEEGEDALMRDFVVNDDSDISYEDSSEEEEEDESSSSSDEEERRRRRRRRRRRMEKKLKRKRKHEKRVRQKARAPTHDDDAVCIESTPAEASEESDDITLLDVDDNVIAVSGDDASSS